MRLRALVFAALPLTLGAQAVQVPRDSILMVSSSRTARVMADRASMYVVVDGAAETAADAVARAGTKMKGVVDALKALGNRVEAERPISYTVGMTASQNGFPQPATPLSYTARSLVRITVMHPEELGSTLASILTAGAANTSGLAFEYSGADSVHRAREVEAIAAARADAQAMAAALGGHVGALVDVSTSGAPINNPFGNVLNFDVRFGAQTPPPELTISATVTMRFRLIH
jgi:uncharacterized protein YggE